MIHLETPKRLKPLIHQAHEIGAGMFRPISRKYDRLEHTAPVELEMLGSLMVHTGDPVTDHGRRCRQAQAGCRRR